ncbi:hypothetical protein SEA_ABBA_63 [Arthrobacter phage Abba]|uniref:Uncharacterized protein n=1 Tax=Arthrobacter phage Abba TaxID=2713256 RepID=A0A6G8R2H9_9CAUD|nr:hypothetical protein HYQ28_gp63 [Arthrobacter phage Abba]QIN94392.1 hypothetical protein SEA_ABBA_63 [Arthrobacter phage Abba]
MSTHAKFTDKDGEEFTVEYDPAHSCVIIHADLEHAVFYVVDGQKIMDGIKSAMLEAALGGTYDAGGPLTEEPATPEPPRCEPILGYHTTPHRDCIMR